MSRKMAESTPFKKINILTLAPFFSFLVYLYLANVASAGFFNTVLNFSFLIISVMVSVYHAEEIAHQIGEGLGTLLLALSVTVIEVGLIVSLMSSAGSDGATVARDTVFSAVMIVCNGIVGICLLLGGLKYKEVGFQFRGANSFLVVLVCLSVFCFILPNYTTTVSGPYYSNSQLIMVSIISLLLYISLVVMQTKTHKYYFESSNDGLQSVEAGELLEPEDDSLLKKMNGKTLINFISLVVGLVSVIGLAKLMAPLIEGGVERIGLPKAVVGLLIATIVLLPEAITAILAARENRIQTSLNLALGSGAASIALTVPVVSLYSIINTQPLVLGLDAKGTVFLLLTFVVCGITLGHGRATALQGIVHLIIMTAYFAITMVP